MQNLETYESQEFKLVESESKIKEHNESKFKEQNENEQVSAQDIDVNVNEGEKQLSNADDIEEDIDDIEELGHATHHNESDSEN